MGEYNRLNEMLRAKQEVYNALESKAEKTDEEVEALADLYQSIGEIKGALLEMAEVDGLSDPYEAFDYCEEPSAFYTEYGYAYLPVEENNGAKAIISIDAHTLTSLGEPVDDGYSIAHVILSSHNDIIVVWGGAEGRENPEVLKLIDKAKDELRKNNSSKIFRTVKITAGMTQEFEIIMTDAPDHVLKAQLMYISACEEEGRAVPENSYSMVEEFGYSVTLIGSQDDFSCDDLDEIIVDVEFDYYDL